jgi:hypothetical protein
MAADGETNHSVRRCSQGALHMSDRDQLLATVMYRLGQALGYYLRALSIMGRAYRILVVLALLLCVF